MRMKSGRSRESGYVLLAVMLTLTLILVALSIEAPRIGQQIKRDKEEELVHRGKDYATAVKRFVHKNGGRYPASIEQLENTNHIRFLRKKYIDPMTRESDWKMVHVGEAQINIPAPNPGLSGGGGQNPGLGGGTGSPTTNPPPIAISQTQTGSTGQQQTQAGGTGQLGTLTTTGIGNGQTVGGGQIMGVASVNKGQSIKEFNDKDHYDEWYFVYDLRLEQSGGSGVTVAAPRGAGTVTGTGTGSSGAPAPTGSQNAPNDSGQPSPTGQPTPAGQPTPTATPATPPQTN
jgi:type II secretory pathway pseudopilin PulG